MKATVYVVLMSCLLAVPALAGSPVHNPDNGHYYQVIETQLSWTDAEAAAQTLTHLNVSGHLVTITSADEQAFVAALMVSDAPNDHCHAGGFQPDGSVEPGGGWSWVTGETWSYTNWYSGEPNQYRGSNEDHLFIFAGTTTEGGQWADGLGSQARWYIVEYDVVPVSTESSTWGAIKALYN